MLYSNEKIEELRHRWTTLKGKKFLKIIKSSHCYLNSLSFRDKIHYLPGMNDPEVQNGIDLRGAPLSGFDFRVSVREDDGFTEDMAILSNINFEGAILRHCNFEEGIIFNCNFENADLTHSNFENAILNKCSFEEADISGINVRSTKFINCNFSNATIKDVSFKMAFADEETSFGKHLKSEKEKNHHIAAAEHKQIKEMYKNSSLHSKGDHHHYRENICKRRSTKLTNPTRWISFIFGDMLCKYGISFVRVFIWSLVIIIGCAVIYRETNSLMFLNASVPTTFADAIYFSASTFTTLGYGDFHVIGHSRFLSGLESFSGAILMSLFTVIAARKIIRD